MGRLNHFQFSNKEAVFSFKFNLCDLKIANTEAASVEPRTEPIKREVYQSNFKNIVSKYSCQK